MRGPCILTLAVVPVVAEYKATRKPMGPPQTHWSKTREVDQGQSRTEGRAPWLGNACTHQLGKETLLAGTQKEGIAPHPKRSAPSNSGRVAEEWMAWR